VYKQTKIYGGAINDRQIKRLSDNAFIPFDPDNTDYQAYLEWVAAGNTPEPAEDA
jgi:hypothetical protein